MPRKLISKREIEYNRLMKKGKWKDAQGAGVWTHKDRAKDAMMELKQVQRGGTHRYQYRIISRKKKHGDIIVNLGSSSYDIGPIPVYVVQEKFLGLTSRGRREYGFSLRGFKARRKIRRRKKIRRKARKRRRKKRRRRR